MTVYYLFWIVLYFTVHIFWDWRSKQTPDFHIRRLDQKMNVLYSAATLASSLLVLLSILIEDVRNLVLDVSLPLVLAGLSGVLVSLPTLCPYDVPDSRLKIGEDDKSSS